MNKFSKLLAGFAVIALAASCGEEPANTDNGENNKPAGDLAYMTICLKDVNSGSKATDGGFEYGTAAEHAVDNAQFLFFDASGVYVGKATPWVAGGTTSTDDPAVNVEFKSNTVVVLDNLTGKDYPSYMITVLNAPDFTPGANLAETAKKLINWGINGKFVMSTTSYYDGVTENTTRHEDAYYYATKITAADFRDQPVPTTGAVNPVDVYVERLAAKVELTLPTAEGNKFKIEATVAGNENGNETGDNVGKTDLYIEINGWNLTNTAADSYMSKNLDGWTSASTIFTGWNDATNYRSYWGKSTIYDANEVNRLSWAQIGTTLTPKYCNENTMAEYATPVQEATSVLIAATVYDAANATAGLDLVRFQGLLFKNADFFSYILNSASTSGNYNYWYCTKEATTTTPVEGGTEVNEAAEYAQFPASAVTLTLTADENNVSKAFATVSAVTLPTSADGKYYQKTATGYVELTDLTAESFKTAMTTFVTTNFSASVEAFNGGKMYYCVPLQHLNETAGEEGFYGVVRNHWYKLSVNKIEYLGHGVFTPGTGDSNDKKIIPDDPEDFFYLGATINILSWKIVNQPVDL